MERKKRNSFRFTNSNGHYSFVSDISPTLGPWGEDLNLFWKLRKHKKLETRERKSRISKFKSIREWEVFARNEFFLG